MINVDDTENGSGELERHVNRKKVLQKQQILNVSLNFKVWNTKDKRELC